MDDVQWQSKLHAACWGDSNLELTDDYMTKILIDANVVGWEPQPFKIRKCYHEIWKEGSARVWRGRQELLKDKEIRQFRIQVTRGSLIVWGHPGVGKSTFLYFALVKALRDNQPVIWVDALEWTVFDSAGVTFIDLAKTSRGAVAIILQNLSPETLILVDATEPPLALQKTKGFIIQATSPKRGRWSEWAKQKGAFFVTMPPWTEEEIDHVIALRLSFNPKLDQPNDFCYSPKEIFEILGPSPRECFDTATREKVNSGNPRVDFNDYLDIQALKGGIRDSPTPMALLRGGAMDDRIAGFHRLFHIDVDPSQQLVDRDPHYRLTLPTRFLRDTFYEIIAECNLSRQYLLLRDFRPAPQLVGLIYKTLVISIFKTTTTQLSCIPNKSTSIFLQLPFNSSPIPYDLLTKFVPQPNTVYVPEIGQPSYDAFVLFPPTPISQSANLSKLHGLILKVTIAKSHTVINAAVRDLVKDVERKKKYKSSKIEWRYIFVVPNEALGKRLTSAAAVASGVSWGAGTMRRTIDVGYLVIDAKDGKTDSLGELMESAEEGEIDVEGCDAQNQDPADFITRYHSDNPPTVQELRAWLKVHGFKHSGEKIELLQRIRAWLQLQSGELDVDADDNAMEVA
ncbi:hypothetical protein HWV62_35824 [Athelia sp. TMB]|nr:hypothetical protein HWV62_35824 [Athelia sp. TMB]